MIGNDDKKNAPKTMSVAEAAEAAEQDFGIPSGLLRGLGMAESGLQHYETNGQVKQSPTGPRGAFQFTKKTAAAYGINRDDPMENVVGAAAYLRDNYKAIRPLVDDDTDAWLAASVAHNRGLGAVHGMIKNRRFEPSGKDSGNGGDTRAYATKIANHWTQFHNPVKTDNSNIIKAETYLPEVADVPQVEISGGEIAPATAATPENVAKLGLTQATPENLAKLGLASMQNIENRPVPESHFTIRSQIQSAADANSPRAAVLLTEANQLANLAPEVAAGFSPVETSGGLLAVNTQKAQLMGLDSPDAIREYVAKNGFAGLIGKVEPVDDTSKGVAVRTETHDGRELSTSVFSTPLGAIKQMRFDKAEFGDKIGSQTILPTSDAVVKREAESALNEQETADLAALADPNKQVGDTDFAAQLPQTETVNQKVSVQKNGKNVGQNAIVGATTKNASNDSDYLAYLEYKKLSPTKENRAQYESDLKANSDFGRDVEVDAATSDTDGQVKSATGRQSLDFFKTAVDMKGKPANISAHAWANEQLIPQLVARSGISADAIQKALEDNVKSDPNLAKIVANKDGIAAHTFQPTFFADAKRIDDENKVKREQIKQSLLDSIAKGEDVTADDEQKLAEKGVYLKNFDSEALAAAKKRGDETKAKIAEIEIEERKNGNYLTANAWARYKVGQLSNEQLSEIIKIAEEETETVRKDEQVSRNNQYDQAENRKFATYNTVATEKQVEEKIQRRIDQMLSENGSWENVRRNRLEDEAIQKKYAEEQRQGFHLLGQPTEATKTALRYIAKLPSTIADAGAIAVDALSYEGAIKNGDALAAIGIDGEKLRQKILTASEGWRNKVDNDLILKQNRAFKEDFIVNELTEGLTQMAVQMIAAPLTGGASLAFPILEAGTSQYREADKLGASKGYRLMAAAIGGLAGVPDVLLKAKYARFLTEVGEKTFVNNLTRGLFTKFTKLFGEEEGRQLTKVTVMSALKNGAFGFTGETVQEYSEDVINGIVAKLTYNPKLDLVNDAIVPNAKRMRGYVSAGFGGLLGGAVETATERAQYKQVERQAREIYEGFNAENIAPVTTPLEQMRSAVKSSPVPGIKPVKSVADRKAEIKALDNLGYNSKQIDVVTPADVHVITKLELAPDEFNRVIHGIAEAAEKPENLNTSENNVKETAKSEQSQEKDFDQNEPTNQTFSTETAQTAQTTSDPGELQVGATVLIDGEKQGTVTEIKGEKVLVDTGEAHPVRVKKPRITVVSETGKDAENLPAVENDESKTAESTQNNPAPVVGDAVTVEINGETKTGTIEREAGTQNVVKFSDGRKTFVPKTKTFQRLDLPAKNTNAESESATLPAHEAATSPLNDLPEPTAAQIEAENYKLGHINVNGLNVSVEIPVGGERKGVNKAGEAWSRTMESHYGYIKRTVGADTENIDVFVKDHTPDGFAGDVFVVDQVHPDTGKFDEHKVMLGFSSETEARAAYAANYAKDWKGLQKITKMPFVEFKKWTNEEQNAPVASSKEAQASSAAIKQPSNKESEQTPVVLTPTSENPGLQSNEKVGNKLTSEKQPFEMTLKEFRRKPIGVKVGNRQAIYSATGGAEARRINGDIDVAHKVSILSAIKSGKDVSLDVAKDYPDILASLETTKSPDEVLKFYTQEAQKARLLADKTKADWDAETNAVPFKRVGITEKKAIQLEAKVRELTAKTKAVSVEVDNLSTSDFKVGDFVEHVSGSRQGEIVDSPDGLAVRYKSKGANQQVVLTPTNWRKVEAGENKAEETPNIESLYKDWSEALTDSENLLSEMKRAMDADDTGKYTRLESQKEQADARVMKAKNNYLAAQEQKSVASPETAIDNYETENAFQTGDEVLIQQSNGAGKIHTVERIAKNGQIKLEGRNKLVSPEKLQKIDKSLSAKEKQELARINQIANKREGKPIAADPKKHSLFTFTALSGGIKSNQSVDTAALRGLKQGAIPILRENGRTVEDAMRSAIDAGYLTGLARGYQTEESYDATVFSADDFVEALAQDARGKGGRFYSVESEKLDEKSIADQQAEYEREQVEREKAEVGLVDLTDEEFYGQKTVEDFLAHPEVKQILLNSEKTGKIAAKDRDEISQIGIYDLGLEQTDVTNTISELERELENRQTAIESSAAAQPRINGQDAPVGDQSNQDAPPAESGFYHPAADQISVPDPDESIDESDISDDEDVDESFDFADEETRPKLTKLPDASEKSAYKSTSFHEYKTDLKRGDKPNAQNYQGILIFEKRNGKFAVVEVGRSTFKLPGTGEQSKTSFAVAYPDASKLDLSTIADRKGIPLSPTNELVKSKFVIPPLDVSEAWNKFNDIYGEEEKPASRPHQSSFDQTDLFGNKISPKTEQAGLFGAPEVADVSEGFTKANIEANRRVFGDKTADYIGEMLHSKDKIVSRIAEDITVKGKLVESKGETAKQIIEDVSDALDLFRTAKEQNSTVAEVLQQPRLDGITFSEQAQSFAYAMEAGNFANVFGKALSEAKAGSVALKSVVLPDVERRDSLLRMKPVSIDTQEIGIFQGIKELRNKIRDVYNSFIGKTVETIDGREVEFNKTGINETIAHSADERVLYVVPDLPQLIKDAIPLWSEAANRPNQPNIKAFHNYGIKTEINGKIEFVRITIREDNDGHLYYDNHVTSGDVVEKARLSQPNRNAIAGEETNALSKDRLVEWIKNVNKLEENRPLYKVRNNEEVDLLAEHLPIAPYLEILDGATGGRITSDGDLELALHDAELIRRGYAELHYQRTGAEINETPFDGAMLRPADFKALLPIFHAKISESVAKGYTEADLKGFKDLARNLEQLAKLNQNTGAIFVFEDALPEEKFHQEDYLAGNTDAEAADKLTETDLWKAAHEQKGSLFAREYGRANEADRISEMAAKLATRQESKYGWDNLDDFENQKKQFLDVWADGVLRKNADFIKENGFEAFEKQFGRITKYGRIAENYRRGSAEHRSESSVEGSASESRGGNRIDGQTADDAESSKREQAEADKPVSHRAEETESVKEDSPETAKRKKAAFSRILGEDVFYDAQSHAETERRAEELENQKGVAQAVSDALYSDKPSAESMRVIYRELTRLNDLADEHKAAGRASEYEAVASELARLTNQIVQKQVALGQATEIAKTLALLSPEHSLTVAARFKQNALGDDATLSSGEITAVKDAATQNAVSIKELTRAENKIEKLKLKIKELRQGTRVLKERKIGEAKPRVLSQVEKKISADLTADFNKYAADLKSLFGADALIKSVAAGDSVLKSVPKTSLTDEQRDALTAVGAKLLFDGLKTRENYGTKAFAVDLTNLAGEAVAPFAEEIHAAAFSKITAMRKAAAANRLTEKLRAANPELTKDEADSQAKDKIEQRSSRLKERAQIYGEHTRAKTAFERNKELTENIADYDNAAETVFAGILLETGKNLSIDSVIKNIADEFDLSFKEARDYAARAKDILGKIKADAANQLSEAEGKSVEEVEAARELRANQMRARLRLNKLLSNLAAPKNLVQRANNSYRAKLVANHATQLFNAVQAAMPVTGAMSQEIFTDFVDTSVRRLRRAAGFKNALDEISPEIKYRDLLLPYAYLFGARRQMAEGVMAEAPEQYFRVFNSLLGDVSIEDGAAIERGTNAITKKIHKLFDSDEKLNGWLARITFAELQEGHFRSVMTVATIDQHLRAHRLNLKELLKTEDGLKNINPKIFEAAADKALRVTFAEDMQQDWAGKRLKEFYQAADRFLPVVLNPVVYARFTYTVAKSVINAHAFGALDAKTFGGAGYTTRSASKGIHGAIAIALAYGLLGMFNDDDDKWYHWRLAGKDAPPLDIRRFFPVSAYAFTASRIKRFMEGRPMHWEEVLEGWASLDLDQYGRSAGLEEVKSICNYFFEIDPDKTERLEKSTGKFAGNTLSGALRFFKPFRDIFAEIDSEERKYREYPDSAIGEFGNEISRNLPLGRIWNAPVKKNPVTGEAVEQIHPAGRIVGLNFVNPMFTSPKPTAAEEVARELFPSGFTGGEQMTKEERNASAIKRELKEAVRRGDLSLKDVEPKIADFVKSGKLTEKAADILRKSVSMTGLQEILSKGYSAGDEKDEKRFAYLQNLMTDKEKADASKIVGKKEANKAKRETPKSIVEKLKSADTNETVKLYDEYKDEFNPMQRTEFVAKLRMKADNAAKAGKLTAEELERVKQVIPDYKPRFAPQRPKPPKRDGSMKALENMY